MKTKEEFMAKYNDQLLGVLCCSFSMEKVHGKDFNDDMRGKYFRQTVTRVVELLREMYDFVTADDKDSKPIPGIDAKVVSPTAPATNGTNGTNGKHTTPIPVRR